MSACAEAYHLVRISQVGAALIIFVFKLSGIHQQFFWSRFARKWRDWHEFYSSFLAVAIRRRDMLLHPRCRLHILQSFGRWRIFLNLPHLRSPYQTMRLDRRKGDTVSRPPPSRT